MAFGCAIIFHIKAYIPDCMSITSNKIKESADEKSSVLTFQFKNWYTWYMGFQNVIKKC